MIALQRMGKPIPKALYSSAIKYATTDGWPDHDTDGLMLTALSHVTPPDKKTQDDAIQKLKDRIAKGHKPGAGWDPGPVKNGDNVNTTAWVAAGLLRTGNDAEVGFAVDAQRWASKQQIPDGSYRGLASDMMATTQMLPLLKRLQSYDNIGMNIARNVTVVDSTPVKRDVYIAMGDSFAAGVGAGARADAECYRSNNGYPHIVKGSGRYLLDYRACSGAKIDDVYEKQLSPSKGDLVTLSIGGNDVGFASVVTDCMMPGFLASCEEAVHSAARIIEQDLPARLSGLYASTQARFPRAKMFVIAYPYLTEVEECGLLGAVFLTRRDREKMRWAVDQMNAAIGEAARKAGVAHIDPREKFDGHGICSDQPWINSMPIGYDPELHSFDFSKENSFHPNVFGNRAYAELVKSRLPSNRRMPADREPVLPVKGKTIHDATADDLAQVAPYLVREPNLKKAEKSGVPREVLLRIDRDLRSGNLKRAKAAYLELKALEESWGKNR